MMKNSPFLVGGEERTNDNINEVRFPYNNDVIARVCQASETDIEDAVQAAAAGFEKTRRMPSHERSRILYDLLHQMEQRTGDFVEAMILEGGKTRGVAKGEFGRALETIRVSAEEAKRIGGEIIPIDWTKAGEQRIGFIRRWPIGPVVGIAPFNYPLNLACHKLGPAVAAGNSFILKPASATPVSALLLGKALLDAGYPPEALSVLPCRGALAERLVTDPRVAFMSFTGSSDVGWHLKSVAGRKRLGLELGGNAAGNSFILKPASATPVSALLLGKALLDAGYPPEALSVLPCRGAVAERLVTDSRVAFMSFTGSSDVGWHLKSVAGRKRVGLELGGNAAAIVHEDANIDYAVGRIVVGGFTNAGQNCISVQRVLLHRPIYQETLTKIIDGVSALKVGDPREEDTDVGPMIDGPSAKKAHAWVREAVDGGARIACGGTRNGTMFQPTVLTDTSADMRVDCQEIFGPVITVSAYDDFDEALHRANQTDFGLQSGVFTQNVNRVMQAFERIEVGGLQVNDVSTFRVDQMPYGGVKGSGIGREGPRYAIEEMTEMKLMVLNLAGGLK